MVDVRSGEIVKKLKGHYGSINDFVEMGEVVITAGDDRQCLIFDIRV